MYQIFADEVLGSGQFGIVYGGETGCQVPLIFPVSSLMGSVSWGRPADFSFFAIQINVWSRNDVPSVSECRTRVKKEREKCFT